MVVKRDLLGYKHSSKYEKTKKRRHLHKFGMS